jgi:hypothetical protein
MANQLPTIRVDVENKGKLAKILRVALAGDWFA